MDSKKIYPSAFTLGAFGLYTLLCFLPGVLGILYSFTDWNSFTPGIRFTGLKNYRDIFQSGSSYALSIRNTAVFTLATTCLKTIIGLGLALLLTRSDIYAKKLHRMIIFAPQVMSFLVVGLVFRAMLHPTTGFVNNMLRSLYLDFLAQNWLTDLNFVFPVLILIDTWKGAGYLMVVMIAGLLSIAPEYYEAADIDGAGSVSRLTHITLPLLSPVLVNATILNITYGLRVFDIIYSLTNGGPGNTTAVINTAVYKEFSRGNLAMSAALSSLLFFMMTILIYAIIKSMEHKETEV